MARKTTALDVARLAGVSRSAVSLVFNGRADDFLAKSTQQRILAAAAELDYTPNLIARSLRNQRSRVIGVLSNSAVTSPFDGAIIAGADAAAQAHGFMIFATDTEQHSDHGIGALNTLLERSVDGLISLTVGLHETTVPETFLTVPSALANCYPSPDSPREAAALPTFLPDEVGGGRVAAEYLIGQGHTRIALLRGEHDSPASQLREQGFRLAMAHAGIPVREAWVRDGGFRIDRGYHAAIGVLDVPPRERPTAILAGNDRAALGVLLAAATLGVEVPRDLSVVGYDDERILADTTVPPLTTMALPLAEMGRRAMQAVLAKLEPESDEHPPPPTGQVLLPCPLVVRESTAPAPS
ncbi:MAG TPA: LacI family DNA-binding transcriptional regulator [Geminicoccaceae bacterium]|nr:LacI family DNA-binding transcriptional regulator [Arachnia sp.]HMU49622.1 LacI family DNA-binding transcriptional regulator [Geminicoccaceae bacterium]